MHFETFAIRHQIDQTQEQEHSTPLFLTSSFTYSSAEEAARRFKGEEKGNIYSRFSNPNTNELGQKLAKLEEAEAGITTASGMAALNICFQSLLKTGDHVLASNKIFSNTKYIFNNLLSERGIAVTYVDSTDINVWEAAVKPNTAMVYIETPANPTLDIFDLSGMGALCKSEQLCFVVDNCFATPYLQKPLTHGADVVIHSATKFIDGQGRVLGGAIVGASKYIELCADHLRRTGACLSPFNAWVLSKSLETLAVRMDRHCSNALAVAQYLQQHPEIETVLYPHLDNYANYSIAKAQMTQGGGLVGCTIQGGKSRGIRFLNALKLHTLTANLGDTRSIATHPASTTHCKLTQAEQLSIGITPGYLRFSVGLEHIEDILEDIDQAIQASL